ncbi:MAG: hypothetical protein ACLUKN_14785 [Bacilli bacterium]
MKVNEEISAFRTLEYHRLSFWFSADNCVGYDVSASYYFRKCHRNAWRNGHRGGNV